MEGITVKTVHDLKTVWKFNTICILLIANTATENLVDRLEEILPGNETVVRYESSDFLSSPDFLHGMGIITNPGTAQITLRNDDGSEFARELPAMLHIIFDNNMVPPYLIAAVLHSLQA